MRSKTIEQLVGLLDQRNDLVCEDHSTYCIEAHEAPLFHEYWSQRGLKACTSIVTQRYPAHHIAFVQNPNQQKNCEDMIGLSISDDSNSPINKILELGLPRGEHGAVFQHTAYLLDENKRFEQAKLEMEEQGIKFMSPVIFSYHDGSGAILRQAFTEPSQAYGQFIEVIQRIPGKQGEPFRGFNSKQIDNLYNSYIECSKNY